MKKIFTTFAMLLVVVILAQSPEKMSYQTVIRNASNTLVINQTVGVKISLLQGSATGSSVYAETHAVTTNANGLASLQIGGGTVVSGTFSSIDWANGPYFIKTETDPNGGSSYTITGTSQLLSVPYALYAKTAGNIVSNSSSNNLSTNVGNRNFTMISAQSPTQLRYYQAIKYCADLVENGYDDWKLATFYEVVHYVEQNGFPNSDLYTWFLTDNWVIAGANSLSRAQVGGWGATSGGGFSVMVIDDGSFSPNPVYVCRCFR